MKILFLVAIGLNVLSFVIAVISNNQSAYLGWLGAVIWSIIYYINKYHGT